MDEATIASMVIYGALGLVPLIYNYRAAKRLGETRNAGGEGGRIYVVVEPERIDLEELENLLGAASPIGVMSRAEEAEA